MGSGTAIEWAHNTFNPWIGCTEASPACAHCYAKRFAARLGVGWGDDAERRPASERMWRQPHVWNRRAKRTGERERVFCASMSDVFERREELAPLRERLVATIEKTPFLDWLLLTKHPENFELWPRKSHGRRYFHPNVWLGVTAEDQKRADERVPLLVAEDAVVHFVSAEPLLGPTSFEPWLPPAAPVAHAIDWVIVGGERGPRLTHPDWVRRLRDECRGGRAAFFFKQWGDWLPIGQKPRVVALRRSPRRETLPDGSASERVGKKAAGRKLDGRTHEELPKQRAML